MQPADQNSCSPKLTPSGQRVCSRFEAICTGDDQEDLGHLVYALLEEESLGGACLKELGLTIQVLADGAFGEVIQDLALRQPIDPSDGDSLQQHWPDNASIPPQWYYLLRDKAARVARRSIDGSAVSSEHLVIAMVELGGSVSAMLEEHGVDREGVSRILKLEQASPQILHVDLDLDLNEDHQPPTQTDPAPVDSLIAPSPESEETPKLTPSTQDSAGNHRGVLALIDANLNRAREGLRVLEDYARFISCAEAATKFLKVLRHQLVETELQLRSRYSLLERRDVAADAGTGLTTANEQRRSGLEDLVIANCRRVQEALRSLEEFGKLISADFSATCKQIRYQAYEAEQMLSQLLSHSGPLESESGATAFGFKNRGERGRRLLRSQLYVLITEEHCRLPWQDVAEACLAGGADILQLREKHLTADERKRRALWLSDLCREHSALFIVNDDPKLAVACDADGLHIGQSDGSVSDCRRILGDDRLLGLSTHNVSQLKAAEKRDIDYTGVGPMFSTQTKSFHEFAGPSYAGFAAEEATLPWFAIGGITADNLSTLVDSGVTRIAVCGSVIAADSPFQAAQEFRQQLPHLSVSE